MKKQKKMLLSALGILFIFSLSAQDDIKNMKKYWYYHYRLVNDFMVKGDCQGCSEPMNQRYLQQTNAGHWGDNLITLGNYISVLATEYKLQHDQYQPTDTTVQELYYALRALNRLDYTAEVHWDPPGSPDLNGYLIRDDVPKLFLANHQKLATGVTQAANGVAAHTIADHPDDSDFQNPILFKDEMSYDQLLHVMQGLALIRTCVPYGVRYHNPLTQQEMPLNDVYSNSTDIWEEAQRIDDRMVSWLRDHPWNGLTWVVTVPNTGGARASTGWTANDKSYGIAEAACFIKNLNDNPDIWAIPVRTCDTYHNFQSLALAGVWMHTGGPVNPLELWVEDYKIEQLAAIGHSWYSSPMPIVQNPVSMLVNVFSGISHWTWPPSWQEIWQTIEIAMPVVTPVNTTQPALGLQTMYRDNQHLSLVHKILHGGIDPVKIADPDFYQNLLNIAPPCGPYNFDYPSNASTYEWSSDSRTYDSERRGEKSNGVDKIGDFHGEYNGLDYMLYYNLYRLSQIQDNVSQIPMVNYMDRKVTVSFPSGTIGTMTTPTVIIGFNTITANNTVGTVSNPADITYQAGNEIALLPGFSATAGSTFHALIQSVNCSEYVSPAYRSAVTSTNDITHKPPTENLVAYNGQTTFVNYPKTKEDNRYSNDRFIAAPAIQATKSTNTEIKTVSVPLKPQVVSGINIIPNPSNGVFEIVVMHNDKFIGTKELKVYDMMGKIIWESGASGNTVYNIDISEYPQGVYYLRSINELGETETNKLVKQ